MIQDRRKMTSAYPKRKLAIFFRKEEEAMNKLSYIQERAPKATTPDHMASSATSRPSNANKKSYIFETVNDIERLMKTERNLAKYLFKIAEDNYTFNCSNLHELKIDQKVGHGNFKDTFKGTFFGKTVAIKVPHRNFTGLEECVGKKFGSLKANATDQVSPIMNALFSRCSTSISNMIREIINHVVFNYPNVARHLGYCVLYETRKDIDIYLQHPGIVSVFEYGSSFTIDTLKALPWRQRVAHCRDLANLFEMFENSLLGSVVYYDFRMRHFKLIDGRITIIDMDDWVSPVEPKCGANLRGIPKHLLKPSRIKINYNITCQYDVKCVDFICKGVNAKYNIHRLTDYFLTPLLSADRLPLSVYYKYKNFISGIQTYSFNASDIKQWLDRMISEFEINPF